MRLEARPDHYADYFRWWARRRPGLRDIYERAAAALEHRAREHAGKAFVDCDPPVCLEVVSRTLAVPANMELFVKHIQRPILRVYSDTDAWIDMGYASWPGKPRGLRAYRRPPGEAAR